MIARSKRRIAAKVRKRCDLRDARIKSEATFMPTFKADSEADYIGVRYDGRRHPALLMMSAKFMKTRTSLTNKAGRILQRDRDTVFPKIFPHFFVFSMAD